MQNLYHRISVRKYEDRDVENEKLLEIIKAGMQAPSAANQQPWEFYIVRDKDILKQLSQVSPYAGPAKNAPVAIVTTYREDVIMPQYAHIDMANCVENMWLATDDLGLGGVWLGICPEPDRMEKVEAILNIPKGQRAFAVFTLGYPAESREQQNRFDETRIHGL